MTDGTLVLAAVVLGAGVVVLVAVLLAAFLAHSGRHRAAVASEGLGPRTAAAASPRSPATSPGG